MLQKTSDSKIDGKLSIEKREKEEAERNLK